MDIVDYYLTTTPLIVMAEPTHYGTHAVKLLADAGLVDLAHAVLTRSVTMEEAAQHLTDLRREGLLSIEGQHVECKLWDWVPWDTWDDA